MGTIPICLSLICPLLAPGVFVPAGQLSQGSDDSVFAERFERHGMGRWMERKLAGRSTQYRIVEEAGNHVLLAVSEMSASALWRRLKRPATGGRLSWRWKVERPLSGNDREREREGDDFAARLFIIFGDGALEPSVRALCYVWAADEPVGAVYRNPRFSGVATVVVESGVARAGAWVAEERDWIADYERVFGSDAEPASAIAILVDTDDTGLQAKAWFDDIILR